MGQGVKHGICSPSLQIHEHQPILCQVIHAHEKETHNDSIETTNSDLETVTADMEQNDDISTISENTTEVHIATVMELSRDEQLHGQPTHHNYEDDSTIATLEGDDDTIDADDKTVEKYQTTRTLDMHPIEESKKSLVIELLLTSLSP